MKPLARLCATIWLAVLATCEPQQATVTVGPGDTADLTALRA